jgi:hypothetical protein
MLELITGMLAAFDLSALGDVAEAGFRLSSVAEAGVRVSP